MFKITKNKTMMEAAYDTIRNAILSGHFKPGDQLIESELIDKLQISRTPLREALRRLETEKLVVSKPYKGVFVNSITKEYAEQLYQVQAILEGLSAELAAHNADKVFIFELRQTIDKAILYKEQEDYSKMIQQTQKFHHLIWKQSKNKVLTGFLDELNAQINLLRGTTLLDPDRSEENLAEHKRIFEAIEKTDCAKAKILMTDHINNAAKAAIRIFSKQD